MPCSGKNLRRWAGYAQTARSWVTTCRGKASPSDEIRNGMILLRLPILLLALIVLGTGQSPAETFRDRIAARVAAHQEEVAAREGKAEAASLPAGVRLLRNIAYGSDAQQAVDVYIPPDAASAPMVVMVHGGAWFMGDKEARSVVENKVARWVPRGFIFVSVNYRMLPALDALDQSTDVAKALAFLQAHSTDWGGDASRLILMGHSAGAHLVALLAADPGRAYELGAKPWLGTVALDSAALDVVKVMESKHARFYDQAFGIDRARWRLASPVQVLNREAKPLLAVCSSQRRDKPCIQAAEYVAKAAEMGVKARVLQEDLSHGDINRDLGLAGPYTDAVEKFMGELDPSIERMLHSR
jgi:arylformamidase